MVGMDPKAVASRVLKAQEEKDFQIWDELFDENVIAHFPFAPEAIPERFDRRDQWRDVARQLFDMFEKISFCDVSILATEDPEFVVATAKSEAKFHSGRIYTNKYVFFFRVRGGKVVEYWEYFNPLAIIKAMGSD